LRFKMMHGANVVYEAYNEFTSWKTDASVG
jgi:hypothetical protein